MLKFYEVNGNRDSDAFKGKIKGPESPAKPWNLVVKHFFNDVNVETKTVSGTITPKLGFEYKGKSFSKTITIKTTSSAVITWVEKLISMYNKDIKDEKRDIIGEETVDNLQERVPVSRTKVNAVAGTSMAIALGGLIGAAIGSILCEQDSDQGLYSSDFLLIDDEGNPVDFERKMKEEPKKFL